MRAYKLYTYRQTRKVLHRTTAQRPWAASFSEILVAT